MSAVCAEGKVIPPWRQARAIQDATSAVCDVRDLDPEYVARELLCWHPLRIVRALMTTAAMVDPDARVEDLLAWTPGPIVDHGIKRSVCKNGHPHTTENMRLDSEGYLRCRVCERNRKAELRAERRAS